MSTRATPSGWCRRAWQHASRWISRLRRYPRQSLRRLLFGRRGAGRQGRLAAARHVGERTATAADLIALGCHARAVLAAGPERPRSGRGPTVVLADGVADAAGVRDPTVLLSEVPRLAVPAFHPAAHNPVGWPRSPDAWAAALGPVRELPAATASQVRFVPPSRRKLLQRCAHVEDVAGFHANAVARAGTLARLAACGVIVHLADRDPALERLLGSGLYALMKESPANGDIDRREAQSIRMRRLALRAHALPARVRDICTAAGVEPPPYPRVSVLLATRRPELLPSALRAVARQDYPNLDLVLALHGDGFDADTLARTLRGSLSIPVQVVRVGAGRPLGAVLNAASAAARGALLTKMDDDDLYGGHVWDLVLAHQYSGAMLVGKGMEYVYLAASDETIRRNSGYAECHNIYLAGGALMIARDDLERVGGWREVPMGEDLALIESVLRIGGAVYRTHGAGFVLVRHGRGHAWPLDEARYRRQAEVVRPGLEPALAGIDDAG